MSDITFTTNNVPRPILDAYEVTEKERAELDYLDWAKLDAGEDLAAFFRYKGQIYDLGEFEVWDNPMSPTRMGWDSFFSGVVVRYVDPDGGSDLDYVIVGRYMP